MRVLVLLAAGLELIVPQTIVAHSKSTSSLPFGAQPDSLLRRFEAANEAYHQGRYERAVKGYRALLEAGHESRALYHNLGNAYVRLDRVGPAIWAYERGRRLRASWREVVPGLGAGDPRLRHNLEYVRRREGLPIGGLPPRGLAALIAGWSPLFLFGVGWLAFGAGLVVAVLRAGPDDSVAWRRPGVLGPIVAGLMLVVTALGASTLQAHEQRAVVIAEQAALRSAPDETTSPDTTLGGGTMVEVRGRRDQWVRVRLRDQTTGWVPTGILGEV